MYLRCRGQQCECLRGQVNYHGKLKDGTVFDSTTDEAFLKSHKRKATPLCFKVPYTPSAPCTTQH